jgi:hypothetical protein
MAAAGCLTAIIFYVVGTLMDRYERSKREREWRDRDRPRRR